MQCIHVLICEIVIELLGSIQKFIVNSSILLLPKLWYFLHKGEIRSYFFYHSQKFKHQKVSLNVYNISFAIDFCKICARWTTDNTYYNIFTVLFFHHAAKIITINLLDFFGSYWSIIQLTSSICQGFSSMFVHKGFAVTKLCIRNIDKLNNRITIRIFVIFSSHQSSIEVAFNLVTR